jgi:hypothetical protein
MNLNQLAIEVARREGKKKSVDIAQIKEIIRITFDIVFGSLSPHGKPKTKKKLAGFPGC